MATVPPLSPEETQLIIQRWQKGGLTDEEKDEFLTTSSKLLADKTAVEALVELILSGILFATWPVGNPLVQKWVSFKERWRASLYLSVGVADSTGDVLERFDQVYLAQVANIETEQDRVNAVNALRPFISELEKDERSATMSRQFLDLKRDIEAFVFEFNSSALAPAVAPLLKDIETLDTQIKGIRALLPIGGALFNILASSNSSSPVLTSLVAQRQKKAEAVGDLRLAMNEMDKLVAPAELILGNLIPAPNINLMLEKLVVFAEIWSSVSLTMLCKLNGGLEAATNAVRIFSSQLSGSLKAELRLPEI
ncbi:hypothetical protein H1R20_g13183, partial [Candolleomyces eurysporus]